MKICIVGPQYPWKGGIAKYLDSLAQALRNQYDPVDPKVYWPSHAVHQLSFTRQYPRLLRKNVQDFSKFKGLDMLNPLSWIRTANKLQNEDFDLVIFKYWHPYFALCFGYIANKLRKSGSRICFIVDNVSPHDWKWFPFSELLAGYCLSNGNVFITHSRKVTDELIKLIPTAFVKQVPHPTYNYGEKITVAQARHKLNLPKMYDPKTLKDEKTRPIILFFGYIRPYKGLDILLHAFAMLQGWREDVLLLVAGEPFEDMSKYKALADALGIYEKVIWHTRYIPDDKVHLYFSAADLLVLPYKSTTQSGVVEIARSFDLPVIATNTGALSEQVNVVVPPNDIEALSGAMMRFFTDNLKCGYKPTITFDDLAKVIIQ